MIREIKIYELSCDNNCGVKLPTTDENYIPQGWQEATVGPCGLTNYYKQVLLCPACYQQHLIAENKK